MKKKSGYLVSKYLQATYDVFFSGPFFSVPVELESQVFVPVILMLLYPQRFMPRFADGTWDAGDFFPAEILELREMSLKLGYRLLKNKPNLIKQVCDLQSKEFFGERWFVV